MKTTRLMVTCVLLFITNTVLADEDTIIHLPSGNTVTIESISKTYFEADKDWALVVSYVTKVPLSNKTEIKAEADELWNKTIKDLADEAKVKSAALMAYNKAKPSFGFYKREREGTVFLFEGGNWHQHKREK